MYPILCKTKQYSIQKAIKIGDIRFVDKLFSARVKIVLNWLIKKK